MQKIPTLFIRDPANMSRVTNEVNPEAAWVFEVPSIATVKRDGTNVRVTTKGGVLDGRVEKRRNPTRAEKAAGAEPGYVFADRDVPADKHIFAAVDGTSFSKWPDGEHPCEAIGGKIQGNAENCEPQLYSFTFAPIVCSVLTARIELGLGELSWYDYLYGYLGGRPREGIVFHERDGERMAKIKRRDFGYPWPVK